MGRSSERTASRALHFGSAEATSLPSTRSPMPPPAPRAKVMPSSAAAAASPSKVLVSPARQRRSDSVVALREVPIDQQRNRGGRAGYY